jgi:hypothetical protein
MTRQYVVGELSVILGELQAVATTESAARDVARLRYEVETTPPVALGPAAASAVELSDDACWGALERGEIEAFVRGSAVCAELREFGICAGLLVEGEGGWNDLIAHL